jgi:hypothetical protein
VQRPHLRELPPNAHVNCEPDANHDLVRRLSRRHPRHRQPDPRDGEYCLGNASLLDCEAADANHDGEVTIEEMLTAVDNTLNGCG